MNEEDKYLLNLVVVILQYLVEKYEADHEHLQLLANVVSPG